MAAKNYDEIRQLIIDTLEGRPAGTMIYPEGHQEIDLNLLDFANAISSTISTGIAGEAQASTQPIQPSGSNVAYIFQVAPDSTKTFTNFRDSGGNAISVTTNSSQAAVGFLLWNGSYWSAMTVYVAVTSPAFETISSDIIQLLDGTTPVYPRTKEEAVFVDGDVNKLLVEKTKYISKSYRCFVAEGSDHDDKNIQFDGTKKASVVYRSFLSLKILGLDTSLKYVVSLFRFYYGDSHENQIRISSLSNGVRTEVARFFFTGQVTNLEGANHIQASDYQNSNILLDAVIDYSGIPQNASTALTDSDNFIIAPECLVDKAVELEKELGYFVCDSVETTAAKSLNIPGYVLKTGGSIKIKFTNSITVNDGTLNISSTGAKPLYFNGVRAGRSNRWIAGEVVEVFYDGTNYYASSINSRFEGVFDVSEYNDGATYASLQLALNAIPVGVVKQGTLIKFALQTTYETVTVIYKCLAVGVYSVDAVRNPKYWELVNYPKYVSPAYRCFVALGEDHADKNIAWPTQTAETRASVVYRAFLSLKLSGLNPPGKYVISIFRYRSSSSPSSLIWIDQLNNGEREATVAQFDISSQITNVGGVNILSVDSGSVHMDAIVDFSEIPDGGSSALTGSDNFIIAPECLVGNNILEKDLDIEVVSENLANPAGIRVGYLISSIGAITQNASWDMIGIPVTPGETYTFGGFYLGRSGYYAFYNGGTLLLSEDFSDPQGTANPVTVTAPANSTILYIDIKSGSSPENPYQYLQINKGHSLEQYDVYKEAIVKIKNVPLAGSGGGGEDPRVDELIDDVEQLQEDVVQLQEGISGVVVDLPVSDGSDISVGYAYIDSSTGIVKVKMS